MDRNNIILKITLFCNDILWVFHFIHGLFPVLLLIAVICASQGAGVEEILDSHRVCVTALRLWVFGQPSYFSETVCNLFGRRPRKVNFTLEARRALTDQMKSRRTNSCLSSACTKNSANEFCSNTVFSLSFDVRSISCPCFLFD